MISLSSFRSKICCTFSFAAIFFAFQFIPPAGAGSLETIIEDFSPLSGYVVMARNGDFIIDLDRSKGVVKGDLFSVVSPGEKIVHPVTGNILGNLEEAKATLRVTRVKDGFSHSRLLEGDAEIKPGDPIRRYENVKAVFWDYSGNGQALYLRLRDELSQMEWVEFDAAQSIRPQEPAPVPEIGPAMVFIFENDALQVRDPNFLIFREYVFTDPVTEEAILSYTRKQPVALTPPPKASAAPPTSSVMAPEPRKQAPPLVLETVKPEFETARPEVSSIPVKEEKEKREGVEPVYQESDLMEKLPGGPVVMTDFLPLQDGLLMAATDGKEIKVYKINGGIVSVTHMDSPLHDPILFLSWWTPDPAGDPMLAVVHYSEHTPMGSIYQLDSGRLRLKADGIDRFIGAFDADGDQAPEMLLAQEYDPEEFFDYKIHEIKSVGRNIDYRIPSVKLPNRFTIPGGLLADVAGGKEPEAVFIRDEILYVYSGIEPLYKSSKQMGGTINKMVYDVDPTAKNLMTNSVSIEIPPVAADLDGDGKKEILSVAAERNLLASSGISPGIKQTWLAVLKYSRDSFNEGVLGERMNTPIQGLTVYDGKVLMVVSETGTIFSKGGQSRLLELPLAK